MRGTPVVVMPAGHPWVEQESVTVAELREERFVAMRSGFVMHRFAQRLFADRPPLTTYRTDGAAMGKLLVADGMGVTLLPDYSVLDDPLDPRRAAGQPADRRPRHGHHPDPGRTPCPAHAGVGR